MNVLDATITRILSEPVFKYDKWVVTVEYECYGQKDETQVMFGTKAEAEKLSIGDVIKV